VRFASWNLHGRTGDAAARLGALLAEQGGADLVLLQEASRGGLPRFCEAAGLDWWVHVRDEFGDLLRFRGRAGGIDALGNKHANPRSVAIAGRGEPMRGATPFPDLLLPEKVLAGWIDIEGQSITVVSYHAPTGAQHGVGKVQQALQVARWLESLDGPVIFGGDFNTPEVDPPDIEGLRNHWHTGHPELNGGRGDDALVGPEPIHGLRDAYRTWLAALPAESARIEADRPDGPLAVTYRTGPADHHRFRFDQIWLTDHFEVTSMTHLYKQALSAGTDHALVLADVQLRQDL